MKLYLFIVLILVEWILFTTAEKSQMDAHVEEEEDDDSHTNYAVHRKINHKTENDKDDLLYFFSLHDYNGDNELDGNELFASFIDGYDPNTEEKHDMDFIIEWVEHILDEDDTDGNGKISWTEYLASQKYHSSG